MSSLLDNDNSPGDETDNDLQDFLEDPSLAALMQDDSQEQSASVKLETVRQSMMLRFVSASSSTCLNDKILLNYLPPASKLFIKSFEETEKSLSRDSVQAVLSKLTLWQNSLEPWHEFLQHLKNVGSVSSRSIRNLLNFLPEIIQTIFSHCKRSELLYGNKFNELLPPLMALFRQTNVVLESFFSILETTVKFDDAGGEKNDLRTVLEKIGDIAILTNGMDTKTLLNTWKAFAKLAAVHECLIKKSDSTECITRRYSDVAKDIRTVLHDSLRYKKETNYERAIKCAGLLLKILSRLCTVYRGYCGNKVSDVLVELLTKLYRYSQPFSGEDIVVAQSKISECSERHIVPAVAEFLSTIVEDKDFRRAFFDYGKSEIGERICYHILTLRIMEELIKRRSSDLAFWLRDDGNIVETALANANDCCGDFLVNDKRISIRSEITSGRLLQLDMYEATLRLMCHFVALTSAKEFAAVEMALLRHLLGGEIWSSLLSCDLWTFLGSIASPTLCYEHVCFLLKVQKNLLTRDKSVEFAILSNLIGRLCKLLPEGMKESAFRDIGDYSDRRLVDPFRESIAPRFRQSLSGHPSIDTTADLSLVFQELRRCPSAKNWTRLTSLLRSIGAQAIPNDPRSCIVTLRSIWNFVDENIPKAQGVTREMLLELIALLLDCNQTENANNPNKDQLVASIYKSMTEMMDHVPIEHRIRMNVFLRENLDAYARQCGKQSLMAITELFCSLVNDDNPFVRQESFETYAEHMLNGPSSELFDDISVGISKLPQLSRQMSLYFSNERIHDFANYESLNNYLRHLAEISKNFSDSHNCYEPDFRQRDEKMPRIESSNINERLEIICDELRQIVKRKNELNDTSIDGLRAILLQLVAP